MILKNQVAGRYTDWNRSHTAPFGRNGDWLRRLPWRLLPGSIRERYEGPFAAQSNNTTRVYEYPWAFYATTLSSGMQVLEIGGGVSGFQFVLSQLGCNIVNVDPGMELEGVRWSCTPGAIAHMNWLFGTSVELRNTVVAKANLEPSSFDRAFSISVLEHLSDHDLREVVMGVFTALRPGGLFILTIDLFLDVAPFTTRSSNQYGRNVNVRDLVGYAPFEIETGDCTELFGFPEFNADRVQSNLSLYLLGTGYPSLVQCLVLRKPLSL